MPPDHEAEVDLGEFGVAEDQADRPTGAVAPLSTQPASSGALARPARSRSSPLGIFEHRQQHALDHLPLIAHRNRRARPLARAIGVITDRSTLSIMLPVWSLNVPLPAFRAPGSRRGNVARRERRWRGHEQRREARSLLPWTNLRTRQKVSFWFSG